MTLTGVWGVLLCSEITSARLLSVPILALNILVPEGRNKRSNL
jgi:hypothetical protein